jgi:hypothetical protein
MSLGCVCMNARVCLCTHVCAFMGACVHLDSSLGWMAQCKTG